MLLQGEIEEAEAAGTGGGRPKRSAARTQKNQVCWAGAQVGTEAAWCVVKRLSDSWAAERPSLPVIPVQYENTEHNTRKRFKR